MSSLYVCNPFRRKPNGYAPVFSTDIPKVAKAESLEDYNGTRLGLTGLKKTKIDIREGESEGDIGIMSKEQRDGVVKKLKKAQFRKKYNVKEVVNKKKKRKRDEETTGYEARREEVVGNEEAVVKEGKWMVGRKRKEMGTLEDVMKVLKKGSEDESKFLRTMFVGNLPLSIKETVLRRELRKFGEVESMRIRSTPLNDSIIPRKGAIIKKQINENVDSIFAYVVFKTEDSAKASLIHNMVRVGGNHIHIARACPFCKKRKGDNSPFYDTKRVIPIGNCLFNVKDEEVYSLNQDSLKLKGLTKEVGMKEELQRARRRRTLKSLQRRDEEGNSRKKEWGGVLREGQSRTSSIHSYVQNYSLITEVAGQWRERAKEVQKSTPYPPFRGRSFSSNRKFYSATQKSARNTIVKGSYDADDFLRARYSSLSSDLSNHNTGRNLSSSAMSNPSIQRTSKKPHCYRKHTTTIF